MAVALVVITAIPVMVMISKGSERRSDEIAISIVDTTEAGGIPTDAAEPGVEISAVEGPAPEDEQPGADMGIGYSEGPDMRAGAYRSIREYEARLLASARLDDLRRDKPASPARRPGNSSRSPADVTGAVPGTPGISLPRLPAVHVGFSETSCLFPIDRDSITEARYRRTEVVGSGR